MNLTFTPKGWEDYLYWQAQDAKAVERVNALLKDTIRSPFKGLGKPEPLRGELSGWWSRRVTAEHRLVYRVLGTNAEQRLEVARCRFHY